MNIFTVVTGIGVQFVFTYDTYGNRLISTTDALGKTTAYSYNADTNTAEARGLEEVGMIECHTLNADNSVNNQIHGIGPRNKKGELYMQAALDYIENRAENALLNIFG